MTHEKAPAILVVGSGGLGSVFGGLLAEHGLPVTLLGVRRDHADAIAAAGGLRIIGFGGDRLIPLAATADPSTIQRADVVIFLCKAGANRAAARSVKHVFHPDTIAVTFQNGLGNEDVLAEILGPQAVVAGLTAQGARLEAPGVARNFTELPSHVGEVAGGLSDRVRWLSGLFSANGLPTTPSAHIMRDKWMKLFANIAFSASSGVTGLSIARVGATPSLHATALRAIDEAAAVAATEGHVFDEQERRSIFDQLLGSSGASANTSSMYRDLQARKPSEVEYIYGTVIARAARSGIPVPTLQTLHALVQGIEASWETA